MTYKYTRLACKFAITAQAVVSNLMPLLFAVFRDSFGISYTQISWLMLVNFIVQLFADAISSKIISALGCRIAGISALLSSAAGLLCLGILPSFSDSYTALLISVIFSAFGGGLLEVMISPIADATERGHSSARMSMLHSFYCWGQIFVIFVSTAAIKLFSADIWRLLPLFWAAVPLVSTAFFIRIPLPEISGADSASPSPPLLKSSIFIGMCALMLCAGASEVTMSQWVSLFAQKGLGIDKFTGDLMGPCLFALFMGLGRLLFGIFGNRLNLAKSLFFCGAMCTACYLTAALSRNPMLALASCALSGFSVSIMWPGIYSYSAHKLPEGGTAMFGMLAFFGDIGCLLGSWLCGTISDFAANFAAVSAYAAKVGITSEQLGLKLGIGSVAVFPAIMLALLLFMHKPKP